MRIIRTQRQMGFTLIELLVVMAVLSILIGIGVNTFTIAQKKARDTKRKADIRQIATALEAYKINNGDYPGGTGGGYDACVSNASLSNPSAPDGYNLVPNYLPKMPEDPKYSWGAAATNQCYFYHKESGNGKYTIFARLEDTNDADTQAGKITNCSGRLYRTDLGSFNYCFSQQE